MRTLLILLLHLSLFASSYNFEEIKYVSAVDTTFYKYGKIETLDKKTIITYTKPNFKQITKTDDNVSIKSSSGDVYNLKGKALYYTKLFIDVMVKLGEFKQIKTNRDFKVEKDGDMFYLTFLEDMADSIVKAEVKTKNSKVISFKMFMPNEDTLEIIKK